MRAVILGLAIFLAGCETTPKPPVVETPKVQYDPPLPKPLEVCDVHWEVLVINNKPYVALSYEDNINLAICAKTTEKYLEELMLVVCHYRQCNKEYNATPREQ